MKAPEWIPVYGENGEESDIPPYEDILFLLGNGEYHIGQMNGFEKLRKNDFESFGNGVCYDCCKTTPIEKRVTHWFLIPQIPSSSNEEEIEIKVEKIDTSKPSLRSVFDEIKSECD